METLYWIVGIVAVILVLNRLVNKYLDYRDQKEFDDMVCDSDCSCGGELPVVQNQTTVKTTKRVAKSKKPVKKVKK